MNTITSESTLTKSQFKKLFKKVGGESIEAVVRYDDQCGNGHNSFSVTGSMWLTGRGRESGCCGCIHEEISKHFPELRHLIKWHLCSSDGPMHYVSNTMYHADEHTASRAWVYYTPTNTDPLGIEDKKERLLSYSEKSLAQEAEGVNGYRVVWDKKTAKRANLKAARNSAVWADATLEQLSDKDALEARLPALLEAFKADVEAFGFAW